MADSKSCRQFSPRKPILTKFAGGQNFGFSEFRPAMSGASANSTMSFLVIHIFVVCGPTKIIRSVIETITVAVRRFMSPRWLQPMKCLAYESCDGNGCNVVGPDAAASFLDGKGKNTPPVMAQDPTAIDLTSVEGSNAPFAGRFIVGKAWDLPPYFHGNHIGTDASLFKLTPAASLATSIRAAAGQ